MLCNRKTNFIFSTHLHKLASLEIIKKIENLKHFYIDVELSKDSIIYGRKLRKGVGEKLYGLEVANYIIDDKDFMILLQMLEKI